MFLQQDVALDLPDTDESEDNPSEPHFFSKDAKFEDLAALRPAAHRRGERLCLQLNESSINESKKIFEYFSNTTRKN